MVRPHFVNKADFNMDHLLSACSLVFGADHGFSTQRLKRALAILKDGERIEPTLAMEYFQALVELLNEAGHAITVKTATATQV